MILGHMWDSNNKETNKQVNKQTLQGPMGIESINTYLSLCRIGYGCVSIAVRSA